MFGKYSNTVIDPRESGHSLVRLSSRIILLALLAAAFSLIILQYSRNRGRLCLLPTYDDVVYFGDGLARLRDYYSGEPSRFWNGLVSLPPKSPQETLLAFVGFALFGVHDWSPYAMNAVIIFGLLAFADYILIGASWPMRALCPLLVLTVPISAITVHEFRPDMACGLLGAAGSFILLEPLSELSARRKLFAGLCWGGALLAKPTMFVFTLAIMGLATLLAVVCNRAASRGNLGWISDLAALWPAWLLPLLLSLPYYSLNGRNIVNYIRATNFSPRSELWHVKGGPFDQGAYFLTGSAGQLMLGVHLYIFGTFVAGSVLKMARLNRREMTRLVSLICLLFVSWLVPSVNWNKQPYFASFFYFLLLTMGLWSLRLVLAKHPVRFMVPICAGILILGLCGAKLPPSLGDRGSSETEARNRFVQEIAAAIKASSETFPGGRRVYLTTVGYLNKNLLRYLYLKQNWAGFTFECEEFSGDVRDHVRQMTSADYVIASGPGNAEVYGKFPSSAIQAETLKWVQAQPEFELVGIYPGPIWRSYLLFRRIPVLSGLIVVRGVGEEEGPYPDWNLPRVRWGLGPLSEFVVSDGKVRLCRLAIGALAYVANQKMIVRVEGKEVGEGHFRQTGQFYNFEWAIDLSPGTHRIEFEYATWQPDVRGRHLTVLFRRIQLLND